MNNFDLKSVSKAIAGALVTIAAAQLAKWGILVTPEANDALGVLLDFVVFGIIGFLTVYFAPKNK